MIDYDPHDWQSHLWDIRGSMLREIFARVATCVLWSVVVVYINEQWVRVGIPITMHSLIGTAIGLLLVFRTNSSYDRFWEGRRMWGCIINESRNMARAAAVHLRDAPLLQRQVIEWTIAFAYATMHRLRGEATLGQAARYLTPQELAEVTVAEHIPLQVARRLSDTLREARKQGVLSEYALFSIDQNTQLLIDYMGACERIQKTPLPFAYMVHLRRGLILYCFSLPFALVNDFHWTTVLLTLLVAYVFFGIEEIGVEIEGPFGTDENDLPLERFCASIEGDLLDCLNGAGGTSAREPAA